jgi:flagellar basal-body rod modification protein FlgD
MSLNTITSPTTSSAVAATSSAALSAISSNFNDFLTLLTTQLQNQDPSSPMDTSQFTSELAQFSGVQQQVDTNTNLTSLIQLAQGQNILQGSSLLGKQVDLNSTTLPLQQSAAHLDFTSPTAQTALITIANASGQVVATQSAAAAAGSKGWDWNGQTSSGSIAPDGAYTASVASLAADGSTTPLTFTTRATVTGIASSTSGVNIEAGSTSISLADVTNVLATT